jgi:hypothetical protein
VDVRAAFAVGGAGIYGQAVSVSLKLLRKGFLAVIGCMRVCTGAKAMQSGPSLKHKMTVS